MTQHRYVDGFRPRRHSITQPSQVISIQKPEKIQPPIKQTSVQKKKRSMSLSIMSFLMLAVVISSTLMSNQPITELAIILYGIIAMIRRIPSRITFTIALCLVVCIPIAHFIHQYGLAVAFASYTFLLLAFGTVCLSRELSKV